MLRTHRGSGKPPPSRCGVRRGFLTGGHCQASKIGPQTGSLPRQRPRPRHSEGTHRDQQLAYRATRLILAAQVAGAKGSTAGPGGVLPAQAHAKDYRAAASAAADRDVIANPARQPQAHPALAGSRCRGRPRRPAATVVNLGLHRGPLGDVQPQPGCRRAVPDRVGGDLVNCDHEIARPPTAQPRPRRPLGHRPAHPPQVTSAKPRRVRRARRPR